MLSQKRPLRAQWRHDRLGALQKAVASICMTQRVLVDTVLDQVWESSSAVGIHQQAPKISLIL